ncbi:MAG: serine/threonine-protein kinase [Chloroflexota bacterium]
MPLATGQVLNSRYRIVKLLGQGGFGAVYRAWDLNLQAPCAVKESLDTSPEAQRQFRHEASMLYSLNHQGLPRVIDSFSIAGQGQYMVMEYIEGEDLQEKLDRAGGPLPEAQVLPWILQVCDALIYLHNQNPPIIHRDIKPANIRVRPDGRAVLVDFGIAKVYDPHLRTTIGARAVTPGYSPLEQYGQGRTDARTDVYALGATLYHLLSGQQPQESIQRATGDRLPSLGSMNLAVSRNSVAALGRAMQLQPDQRFQSTAAFKQALVIQATASKPWPATVQVDGATQIGASRTQAVALPQVGQARAASGAKIPAWGFAVIGLFVVLCVLVVYNLMGGAPATPAPPAPTSARVTSASIADEPVATNTRRVTSSPRVTPSPTRPVATQAKILPTATNTSTPTRVLPSDTPTSLPPQVLYLRPSCGKSFTVQANRPIHLIYGLWGVKGADLARETRPAINVRLTINGSRLQGELQSDLLSMSEVPCGTNLDGAYWVYYTIDLGSYSSGTYSIQVDFTFSQEITDGYDVNKDGKLDTYNSKTPIQQKYTLVVK